LIQYHLSNEKHWKKEEIIAFFVQNYEFRYRPVVNAAGVKKMEEMSSFRLLKKVVLCGDIQNSRLQEGVKKSKKGNVGWVK